MFLQNLTIINYKNIEQAELTLSPKINCFIGDNGMGKTNILDSIYYLSFCKSYTNPIDSQIINHNNDFCVINGKYQTLEKNTIDVYSGIKRKNKKKFKIDKKEYEKLSEHIGLIPLVMVSPYDINLIMGGSEERRRFIDVSISQFDKEYINTLVKYNKALMQRNSFLKKGTYDNDLLDVLEEQMYECAKIIYPKRKQFIEDLCPIFNNFYSSISKSKEEAQFKYISQLTNGDFIEQIRQARAKDLNFGHTTVGIHKDDIEMLLNGYTTKRVGSQGQNKTFFVSIKLAQFQYLKNNGSKNPILLLDDIFDRLDSSRVTEIIKIVSNNNFGQIFISDTNRSTIDEIIKRNNSNYKIFHVSNGLISNIQ